MIGYIIDTHIVNHYENCIPNAVLFFILGCLFFGETEYRESKSIVNIINSSITGGLMSSMTAVVFGQPMFIVFSGVMISLCIKGGLKFIFWVYERYNKED